MNICLAINRCFTAIVRCASQCFGDEDSLLPETTVLRILNVVCTFFAMAETAWITGYLFLVLIPWHYQDSESLASTSFLLLWGALLAFSVPYHYYKARGAKPIKFPKTADGHCSQCSAPKPRGTSHCSTCSTCVYRMDHHCPWIGQCVGAHNQANFFLFLWSVFQATVLVLYVHWRFWLKNVRVWKEGPWPESLMEGHGMTAAFTLFLVFLLHLIIASFLVTYIYLVSDGLTYMMKMFKTQKGKKGNRSLEMLHARWLQYLAVPRGGSILKALIVPSDRTVEDYEFFQ